MKIDLTYLQEISENDSEFIVEILSTCKEQIPTALEEMKNTLLEKEYVKAGETAHFIKSSIASLGLTEWANQMKEFEINAKSNADPIELNRKMQDFENYYKLILPELDMLIQTTK